MKKKERIIFQLIINHPHYKAFKIPLSFSRSMNMLADYAM